jgi:DsbC/DsbD-like thiol-disulfide interchange protein
MRIPGLSRAACLAVGLALLGGRGAAQEAPRDASAGHVEASLLAEQAAAVPGAVLTLGVHLRIDEGWHTYAAARNDTGLPVLVQPRLPAGWEAGPVEWPLPLRHLSPGPMLDHVYEQDVLLAFDVTVPAEAVPGTRVSLGAHVEWLVCQEICVAGGADVALDLPVAERGAVPATGAQAARFAAVRAQRPEPWPPATSGEADGPPAPIRAEREGLAVRLLASGAASLTLIPAEDCVELPGLIDEGVAEGDALLLHPSRGGEAPARLKGTVLVRYPAANAGQDPPPPRRFALDLPLPAPAARPAAAPAAPPAAPSVARPVSPEGESP